MEKVDFLDAADKMEGSRDTGAQLFCGMLRAVGVDARLMCSLQPLQFRAIEKIATPQRQYVMKIPEYGARPKTPEIDHTRLSDEVASPISVGSYGGRSRYEDGQSHQSANDTTRLPERSKGEAAGSNYSTC